MDWREKTSAEKGEERAVSRENALFEEKTHTHRILAAYLYDHRDCMAVLVLVAVCFSAVAFAFQYPPAAIGYALLLAGLLTFLALVFAYFPYRRRYREMVQAAREEYVVPTAVLHGREAAYQALFCSLRERKKALEQAMEEENRENGAYFTTWAHQIKVPIAAIRLILAEDAPDKRAMGLELAQIEQYADMVLAYQRLRDRVSDYVFRECDLTAVINGVIRKQAPWFIRKKLTLDYDKAPCRVVTDEKWFSLIAEQLLSNAIKYTPTGGTITVRCTDTAFTVSDTGIGIAPEDLPRIFERGFTGANGRLDDHATGIGLYLCRQICDRLGYAIHVTSTPRAGSTFTVCLRPGEDTEACGMDRWRAESAER